MTPVTLWTGQQARALRGALRMSVRTFAEYLGVAPRTVAYWESGGARTQPRAEMQELLDTTLRRAPDHTKILFEQLRIQQQEGLLMGHREGQDGEVNRRSFLPATALPLAGAAIAPLTAGMSAIVSLLTPFDHEPSAAGTSTPLHSIAQAKGMVGQAKSLYQACRYDETLQLLPDLLVGLGQLARVTDGDQRLRISTLAADTYHVVASVLLKLDDTVLATLAARRALREAQASGDPIALAASSRIMTHVFMSAGHNSRAVTLAAQAAQALRSDQRWSTPDGLSVLGALVLRAAVAAARGGDREAAAVLLDEAEIAAARFGRDANDRWTGFGPTNVQLHRVNVALVLGDAGTAIDLAHRVDSGKIQLLERKACLFTDVAQAYLQWGKHAQALTALENADRIAPEEVRTRSTGRRICADLLVTARGPVRDRAISFATRAGLHR